MLCRSQPEKSDSDLPLVSASQPCLIDTDAAFPHLMKPSRVSKEAYNLRKNRLLRHKYEDIDIPEWVEVGGAPGSDTSVGDMPSPAVRDSWLEADKDSGECYYQECMAWWVTYNSKPLVKDTLNKGCRTLSDAPINPTCTRSDINFASEREQPL